LSKKCKLNKKNNKNINNFIKADRNNKFSFLKEKMNRSIHSVLNDIRSWDSSISSFLVVKILRLFTLKQKGKFKNIISEFIDDKNLWLEIEKMFDSGYVNMSLNTVYTSINFFSYLCFVAYMNCIFHNFQNSYTNYFERYLKVDLFSYFKILKIFIQIFGFKLWS